VQHRQVGFSVDLMVQKKGREMTSQADHIADAIVELVEQTDGPVTLARIDREILGFAKKEPPTWEYVNEHASGETLIWNGMTKAGLAALRNVMCGRRVAVQHLIHPLLYLLDGGGYPQSEIWMPVVLLPVRAANLDTPNWRLRGSEILLGHFMRKADEMGLQGYRRLTPSAVPRTADRFAA
jgi:hypothetical protein